MQKYQKIYILITIIYCIIIALSDMFRYEFPNLGDLFFAINIIAYILMLINVIAFCIFNKKFKNKNKKEKEKKNNIN